MESKFLLPVKKWRESVSIPFSTEERLVHHERYDPASDNNWLMEAKILQEGEACVMMVMPSVEYR